MKSLKHIIANIAYMTKTTYRFARAQYFIALFTKIPSVVMPFINLYFPKWILDELSGGRRFDVIIRLVLTWAAINAGIALVNRIIDIQLNAYHDKCNYRENMHYLGLDTDMDYEMLEKGETLDEQGRIGSNISLTYFSSNFYFRLLSNLIQFIGFTYIIATLHPLVIVFVLVIICLNGLVSKKVQRADYVYGQESAKYRRRFEYLFRVFTTYQSAKELRINNASSWVKERYEKEIEDYSDNYGHYQNKVVSHQILTDVLFFIQTVGIYIYSARNALLKIITIGDLTLFVGVANSFISSFNELIRNIHGIKYISEYIDAYRAFVDKATPSIRGANIQPIDRADADGKHEIEFVGVSFRYPGSENYALRNVSIKIQNGERLSIVGYNGSGKSTFIKLLCRLYAPTEGVILYNGVNIAELDYTGFAKCLSVVFQDYNIYSMTMRDNICVGNPVEQEKIDTGVDLCGLSDKVKLLPRGLDTEIGKEFDENGVEFSGGEQQKLSMVRAYCKDAPVFIMDEPTASLDPLSEYRLYERFDSIVGEKTAVYVTHRLASVKFCDSVAVFANGQIVERGTHSELMAMDGIYKEMFDKQAEYYIDQVGGDMDGEE